MQFREHTLDNGLEIIAECNPQARSQAVAFFVKAGSRDETPEISGVSHFLEHMAFKGTPRRSAEDVNREFDEIGSHSNASTSHEQTIYYAKLLPEHQDRAVDLLADILRPSLREDDFETEKQVIVEEIYMYDDQPPFGAHDKAMAAHFGEHPLGRSILGTVESVTGLSPEAMRAYFEQRYSPRNIALAAAGNVDFEGLVAAADRLCGSWRPFDAPRDTNRPASQASFQAVKKDQATQQYVVKLIDGPAAADEDRRAARLMTTMLADDSGSRFYWELVDPGLAEYAAMSPEEFQGAGVIMTYLCCAPEQAAANMERMLKLEREAQDDGFTAEELERAKAKTCSSIVLSGERPGGRMFAIGNQWIQRREYRTVKETIEAYRAVTLDDIHAVLARYPLTPATTYAIGPLEPAELPAPG